MSSEMSLAVAARMLSSALVAALFVATSAQAATVTDRSTVIEIQADGSISTREELSVRLDSTEDLARWSPYFIGYDQNSSIEKLEAWVTTPDGKTERLGRKDLDVAEVAGEGELHSSRKVRSITFSRGGVGATLGLRWEISERPYFPAERIVLGAGGDPVARRRIEIRGGGAGFRYRLAGGVAGWTITPTAGGVVATAVNLPAERDLDRAPTEAGGLLRYAWGSAADWPAIARWWQEILRPVPRGADGAADVRREAQRLTASLGSAASPRAKLVALLPLVQRDVRYVAVEVGIGGFRPTAPSDVLTRRWGDCKDKALLLAEMLTAVGVPAYPALALLDAHGRVDREFPSPFEFNHAIVAIPTAGFDVAEGDPIAGGYLFVDATQTLGSPSWLSPSVQDQEVLVVRGDGGELVRTPIVTAFESTTLSTAFGLDAEGNATGQARLALRGEEGARFVFGLATNTPNEIDATLRSVLGLHLPGATITDLRGTPGREGVPRFEIAARVATPHLFAGSEGSASAVVPSVQGLPAIDVLDDRVDAVVLEPGTWTASHRLALPSGIGCTLAEGQDLLTENDLGRVRQTVRMEGAVAVIERTTEVHRRFIEPADFAVLRELALAEDRNAKRRVRFVCSGS